MTAAKAATTRARTGLPLLLADVFVPDLRTLQDELREEIRTVLGAHIDDIYPPLAQPVEAAAKCARFPDDDGADLELNDQTRTIPAGRERRDHDRVTIVSLTARFAKGVGFGVHGGVGFLDPPITPPTEQCAIIAEQRSPDRDAALGRSKASFLQRNGQHCSMVWYAHRSLQ